jgi:hypothetical protein
VAQGIRGCPTQLQEVEGIMTDELIDLARSAVACDHWRWMPGMLWWTKAARGRLDDFPPEYMRHPANALPDLSDPATLGCLLALVREAWRCPTIYVRRSHVRRTSDNEFGWEVCDLWLDEEACRALGLTRQGSVGCWGHKSEAEALVFALVNAP